MDFSDTELIMLSKLVDRELEIDSTDFEILDGIAQEISVEKSCRGIA